MKLRGFICLVVMLTACEEVVDRPIASGEKRLVVEGILTNERTVHKVKIGWSFAEADGVSPPVTGAFARIIEGATVYPLTENPAAPGEYLTPEMRAVFGRDYILHINYSGQDYTAQDRSVPVEPLTPLQVHGVTGGYVLTLDKTGQDPNYIRHEITWKNTANCQGGACDGLVVYYDLKTIDVQEGTKPPKEDFVFPAGSLVIRKKYSVSPAYKSFLRGVLSETEWRGSAFDVERANAPTNLTNGAIGFFAVTTVTMDSTVVE
jgi:hypothetical protein